ncbi:hypothetical protein N657DRAFT_26298 [Parathielavia appendiculata]|uniref:Uncharacterized protein n=1 Tax=Parathielavia appendiculata TaxID=2587402 RepID=A0AAN6Z822_9PEZI|nr:hypothetical protein N657DRAFT_26298 [Parathielavia appendiculata]
MIGNITRSFTIRSGPVTMSLMRTLASKDVYIISDSCHPRHWQQLFPQAARPTLKFSKERNSKQLQRCPVKLALALPTLAMTASAASGLEGTSPVSGTAWLERYLRTCRACDQGGGALFLPRHPTCVSLSCIGAGQVCRIVQWLPLLLTRHLRL